MDFAAYFERGLTYDDFLAQYGTDEHRRRWQGVWDEVRLNAAQQELLASFRRTMKVLCLAGAWCGDCVQQCPIFGRFGSLTPTIELRYFDRDAHPELAAALKICGGARVPVLVFLAEDGAFCGLAGDRMLSKYRSMASSLDGAACPTGITPPETSLLAQVTQDWLNEFERIQLMLRTSSRLRQLHGD